MAFETDLIRRYTGAFTKNDCERIIDGIKFFEDNNLLFYDRDILDRQDHKVINITHEYNFSMSSRICDEMFPKLKPCVDEYLKEQTMNSKHMVVEVVTEVHLMKLPMMERVDKVEKDQAVVVELVVEMVLQ